MLRYHCWFPRLLSARPSVGSSNRSGRFAMHSPASHLRPCRRSGDPPRRGPEGKLELTEAARLTNRAGGNSRRIPPGRARKGRSERQGADGRQESADQRTVTCMRTERETLEGLSAGPDFDTTKKRPAARASEIWRRRAGSNRCIAVLQTAPLTTWVRRPARIIAGLVPISQRTLRRG